MIAAIESVDLPDVNSVGSRPALNYHTADLISPILQDLPTSVSGHASIGEAFYLITRAVAATTIIALLIFFFYHD